MQTSQKNLDSNFEYLAQLLSTAQTLFEQKDYFSAFQYLSVKLDSLYDSFDNADLENFREITRNHPVFNILQQDPYTNRAYTKPRGYAGDAVMMDYVYSGIAPSGTTTEGQGVFECSTRSSLGLSVVFRKALLNTYLNDVFLKNQNARILSVASGHCRELSESLVLSKHFKGEFIAFDQDAKSCDEIKQVYQDKVKTVVSSIKKLWGESSLELGQFDFIYSAGLYDYLPKAQAYQLTEVLKSMLKPGGRLVVGNFTPSSTGRGYLDLIMDWHLIYRNQQELIELFGDLTGFSKNIYDDPYNNICYIDITKSK